MKRATRDQLRELATQAQAGELPGPVLVLRCASPAEAWQHAPEYAAAVRRLGVQEAVGVCVPKALPAGVYLAPQDGNGRHG